MTLQEGISDIELAYPFSKSFSHAVFFSSPVLPSSVAAPISFDKGSNLG